MTDRDFHSLLEFRNVAGNALVPVNQEAIELTEQNPGKTLILQEKTARDLKFHRAYFALLNFIWSWMPKNFKEAVPEKHFYQWLKHLQGKYKILYEFKDGSKFIEYESISFGRMSQEKFVRFVREQLTTIYNDLIYQLYDKETADMIVQNIEGEFESYLSQL